MKKKAKGVYPSYPIHKYATGLVQPSQGRREKISLSAFSLKIIVIWSQKDGSREKQYST